MQKFLFDVNRDPGLQKQFLADRAAVAQRLSSSRAEERGALMAGDVGLVYVLGANGQLLMHFAALLGMEWSAYIGAMREGIAQAWPGARGHLRHDDALWTRRWRTYEPRLRGNRAATPRASPAARTWPTRTSSGSSTTPIGTWAAPGGGDARMP